MLEQGTVDLLNEAGLGARMQREGLVHEGLELSFAGRRHRIDLAELTGGRKITVYGQHEVVKDLIAARLAAGGEILFEVDERQPARPRRPKPKIRFRKDGAAHELALRLHRRLRRLPRRRAGRACRTARSRSTSGSIRSPGSASWRRRRRRREELIYASHERGFALHSMRSPELTRLYLQCAPDEDIANWPDERIWEELQIRLGVERLALTEGPVLQKGITPMRSFVAEPMRYGRLFLAGDAAHIVPPTGAKGMNLAVADVRVLAQALVAFYRSGRSDLLDAYSAICLRRIWKVQRFSWWMTSMLHRFPGRRRLRPPHPDGRARLCHELARGRQDARRELRRPAVRLNPAIGARAARARLSRRPHM